MSVAPRSEPGARVPRPAAELLRELEDAPAEAPGRVADAMLPVGAVIPTFASAEAARRTLEREGLRFLLVVGGTGRLAGAVDRVSLAARDCCAPGKPPCRVVQHLAADVAFCFGGEDADEVLENEAELADEGFVPRVRAIPMIVVDPRLVPLGIFDPAAAGARHHAELAAPSARRAA